MTFSSTIPAPIDHAATGSDGAPRPVAFGDCFGRLHPAGGEVGIVLCGGWGYEALSVHRACAELADMLAGVGYPTLRFDYPGTGDSKGDFHGRTLQTWIDSVPAAAARLRELSGARRIVLAGFGFGCLMALAALRDGFEADGLVLLAPPLSGRRYIRETQALAAMVASPNDGGDTVEKGALTVAGFVMPASFADEVRALDISGYAPPADVATIILARPDSDIGPLSASLAARGAQIAELPFEGHAQLVAGPIMAKTPTETFARLTDALVAALPPRPSGASQPIIPPAVLKDGDCQEEAIRFGEDGRLFGVLCEPNPRRPDAPIVVILNVGRNPHTGWRRMPVEHARALARRGIASLRFDIGGIGDSAPRAGQPAQILYSDWPVIDVVEALDFVSARKFGPITLAGICSGAYIALQSAVADARVAGLVDVNLFRMVWDPADSVEAALRFGNRAIGAAVTRLFTRERLRKVLTGEADLRPAIRHTLNRAQRRLGVATMAWFGSFGPRGFLYAECMRRFAILRARRVETVLCYSADDEGHNEIEDYFGRGGKRLSAYPNVRLAVIENCDHNFTPPHAASWLIAQIEEVVARTLQRAR